MPYTQDEIMRLMFDRLNQSISVLRGEIYNQQQNKDVTGKAYAFPAFAVADLPTSTNIVAFMVAYATDGRKSGEGAGNGTGVPVWFNTDTNEWLTFYDNSVVQA